MTAVTGLSVLYYKSPPYKKTAPHHRCGLRLSKNLYRYQKWVFSVARSAGFASCKTFGKQPKHPCFGRSPKAGRRDASPRIHPPARMPGVYAQGLCTMQSQPSIHSLSRGKGGFGKDAEIRTHQALSMDAYKWSNKVGAGRTDNKRPRLHRGKAIRVS